VIWIIGFYALLAGVTSIAVGFRLRTVDRTSTATATATPAAS
jgi:hypothetical protein